MIGQHLNTGSPVNRAHPLCQGIGWWWKVIGHGRFCSGLALRDLVAGKDGTLTNGAVFGGALSGHGRSGSVSFDATDDYCDIGASNTYLTAGSPFTIAWWERHVSAAGTYFTRFVFDLGGSATNLWLFRTDDVSYGYVNWARTSTSIMASGAPTIANSLGIWNHFALTGTDPDSNTAGDFSFYVNGVSVTVAASINAGTPSANNRIGYVGVLSGPSCAMDDVMIWPTRRLSVSEALNLYQNTIRPDNPMLNWIRPVRVNGVAAAGRTTKNTRAFPLGVAIGMDFNHCNI